MCGATSAQNQLQTEQAAFYQEATQQAQETYGEDQEILGKMTSAYEPILAAGPNQEGFSEAENNNLNTQATEGVAGNYNNASKALREQQAAEGAPLPTGEQSQQQEALASSAAGQQSEEQQQIKQADYTQGYNEWQNAASGLTSTAGLLNPTGYEGAATGAGSAEGETANQIASENDSWVNAAIGAGSAIGGGIISENPGDVFG